ncbi:MAG: MFS transporter, partial [Acidimicrobiales bacterium]
FVAAERRNPEPLLDLRYFRNPSFAGAASIAVLAFLALFGFIFFNTLYLQQVRGYSAVEAGLATLPTTGLIMFVSPLSGRLTARRGPRLPITVAGFAILFGLVVLFHTTPTVSLAILFSGYVLVGLGIGLINPPITNAAIAGMPPEQAGVASAVTGASRQVGGCWAWRSWALWCGPTSNRFSRKNWRPCICPPPSRARCWRWLMVDRPRQLPAFTAGPPAR